MADPASKDSTLKRTYDLTIPVLDLMGDSPADSPLSLTVQLVRTDGASDSPLFGPDGLIAGDMTQSVIAVSDRPSGSALDPATAVLQLIPTAYWFVPTRYLLTAAGRVYQFTMPAEDSSLITLLPEDASSGDSPRGGGSSGTVTAQELPVIQSVADATALANLQVMQGRSPILARVTADFSTWETGDVLIWQGATDGWALVVRTHTSTVRTLGSFIAWWGAGAIPATAARTAVSIRDSRPALAVSHGGVDGDVKLNVAYPDSLDSRVESILVDGQLWTPEPLVKGSTAVDSSVAYRLYSSRNAIDVTGGVGPLNVELVLRPTT